MRMLTMIRDSRGWGNLYPAKMTFSSASSCILKVLPRVWSSQLMMKVAAFETLVSLENSTLKKDISNNKDRSVLNKEKALSFVFCCKSREGGKERTCSFLEATKSHLPYQVRSSCCHLSHLSFLVSFFSLLASIDASNVMARFDQSYHFPTFFNICIFLHFSSIL